MSQKEIYNHLLDKGFNKTASEILAENLVNLAPELQPLLEIWFQNNEVTDFQSNRVRLYGLMADYDMQYPAALLTMDWILKEPDLALEALKKGIR